MISVDTFVTHISWGGNFSLGEYSRNEIILTALIDIGGTCRLTRGNFKISVCDEETLKEFRRAFEDKRSIRVDIQMASDSE